MTRYLFLSAFLSTSAMAHDAPSGWKYPYECCSSIDCRQVPDDWVDRFQEIRAAYAKAWERKQAAA